MCHHQTWGNDGKSIGIWGCLKMGYTPNKIAIFRRDNDQQNHWVQWGTQHFQTNPFRNGGRGWFWILASSPNLALIHRCSQSWLHQPICVIDTQAVVLQN